jgi:hypothetical protein
LGLSALTDDSCGKQRKLESKLGGKWSKPKGMHHRTYELIMERILKVEYGRELAIELGLSAMLRRNGMTPEDL